MKSIITTIIMLAAFVVPSYAITGTVDTIPSDTFKIVEIEGKMYKLQGQTLTPLTIEEEPKIYSKSEADGMETLALLAGMAGGIPIAGWFPGVVLPLWVLTVCLIVLIGYLIYLLTRKKKKK